jgi:glutaredoxin-like protein NrdH
MAKALRDYAKNVPGSKKGKDLFLFTLSTCGWCMKTKQMLKDMGVEYSYIDVDLADEEIGNMVDKEFSKWNPSQSFPTIVVDGKRCIIGFDEEALKEIGK